MMWKRKCWKRRWRPSGSHFLFPNLLFHSPLHLISHVSGSFSSSARCRSPAVGDGIFSKYLLLSISMYYCHDPEGGLLSARRGPSPEDCRKWVSRKTFRHLTQREDAPELPARIVSRLQATVKSTSEESSQPYSPQHLGIPIAGARAALQGVASPGARQQHVSRRMFHADY